MAHIALEKSLFPNILQGHWKIVLNALVMRQRLAFKSNSINQSIWSAHMTPLSALYAPARLSYVVFTAPEVMRYIMLVLECITAPEQAAQQTKKKTP